MKLLRQRKTVITLFLLFGLVATTLFTVSLIEEGECKTFGLGSGPQLSLGSCELS
jgi:hypothetical protein